MTTNHHIKQSSLATAVLFALAAPIQAAPIQWSSAVGGNDHWYELVAGQSEIQITWSDAKGAAQSRSHLGNSGYLATITSAGEQDFLVSNFKNLGVNPWIDGSDAEAEGVWRWTNGPEASQLITLFFWYPGEPNNYQGEDKLHMLLGTHSYDGRWNDLNGANLWQMGANGYIVEYPGAPPDNQVPEPGSLVLFGIGLAGLGAALRRRR